MRKITIESVDAFAHGDNLSKQNMVIETIRQPHLITTEMYLHGNLIACINQLSGKITINDAGWQTTTTKERLNGILDYYNLGKLYQKQ